MRYLLTAALCCGLAVAATAADEKKPADPVKKEEPKVKDAVVELKLDEAKLKANENGKASEPTVIKSEDDLKKAVGDDAAKAMKIDFKKEYLLLFQWGGSGGDKLSAATAVKDGKTVVTFTLSPGRTFDLRQHAHLYQVAGTDTEWKFGK